MLVLLEIAESLQKLKKLKKCSLFGISNGLNWWALHIYNSLSIELVLFYTDAKILQTQTQVPRLASIDHTFAVK